MRKMYSIPFSRIEAIAEFKELERKETLRFKSPEMAERYLKKYGALDKFLAFMRFTDNSPRYYAALNVRKCTQEEVNCLRKVLSALGYKI